MGDLYHGRELIVGALEEGERVSCYYCSWPDNDYGRGQAVLAGPDHPPLDANANYVCLDHLFVDDNQTLVIVDSVPGQLRPNILTLDEYRALAPKCGDCEGDGYLVVPDHAPGCDGDCGSQCPIPVQVPCRSCAGPFA